ncbi:MAG TPA: NUDIX hydrolase [Gemmata sp.]|nr:NUDIX hydrolase [Gemmata sp.]
MNQTGVIPVLNGRLCMVTSRSGRRWVFPKGVIEERHTPREAGLIEAWEEAGLEGTLDPEPVGSYVYEKLEQAHHVLVFRMRVVKAHDTWPEQELRNREWVSVAEAIERTEEKGLRELLRHLFNIGRHSHFSAASA